MSGRPGLNRRSPPPVPPSLESRDSETEEADSFYHRRPQQQGGGRTSLGRLLGRFSLKRGDNSAPLPSGPPPEHQDEERHHHGFFGRFSLKRGTHKAPLPAGPPPDEDEGLHDLQVSHHQGTHHGFFGRFSLKKGNNKAPLPPMPPPSPTAIDEMNKRENGHHRHFHLPKRPTSIHLFGHRHHDGEFEYAFENPDMDDADSDSETVMTDSASTATGVSDAEKGRVKRIKGGVRGGGFGLLKPITNRHVCERIFMALLAVSFLWITSYILARELVNYFITTPEWNTVRSRTDRAYSEATDQSNRYISCVEDVATRCELQYNESLKEELDRTAAGRELNREKIDQFLANVTFLEQTLNETLSTLNELVNSSKIEYKDYTLANASLYEECEFVADLIAGQDAAIQALASAKQFQSKAEKRALSLQAQIYARDAYNDRYLAKKTEQYRQAGEELRDMAKDPQETYANLKNSYAGFQGCFVAGGTCSHPTAFDAFSKTYTDTFSTFTDMKAKATSFKAEIAREMNNYRSLIDSLSGNVVEVFLDLDSNIVIPSRNDANEPTSLNDLATRAIAGIKSPNDIFAGSDVLLGQVSTSLDAQEVGAQAQNSQFAQTTTSFYDYWTEDYDPPKPGDSNNTVEAIQNDGNTFAPELSQKLRVLSVASKQKASDSGLSSQNTSSVSLESSSEALLASTRNATDWQFYVYSEDIIDTVNTGITDMSNLILYFDLAFRIFHTIFIIRKYWVMSGLSTPPGDARVKADVGQGWGPKASPLQKIAAIITNPIVITLLLTATVVTLLYLTWYAYSPIFYQYVDGCVKADDIDIAQGRANGTMFYRNGYSVMFQYAAADGDKLANRRVDELNVGRDLQCNQNSFDDTIEFNSIVDRYDKLLSRWSSILAQHDALVNCLDLPAIDLNQNVELNDAMSHEWFDGNFQNDPPNSTIAVYNCEAIKNCDERLTANGDYNANNSACEGPNVRTLQAQTHSAACTAENWIHAQIFGTFMVFAVFTLMNLSRLVLMRSIVRLSWRHLVSGPYSFLGSCTDSGRIVYPEVVEEKGKSMREAIADAVKKRLREWERWGYVLFFVALGLNAPWIWGLYFLRENLEYRGN